MTRLSFDDVASALLSSRWIFAKTMPQHPHWYTLRKEWAAGIPFDDVVQYIRDHGYREKFGRSWYVRLNVNGMKYWTMGAPLQSTILINRAEIEAEHPYDPIGARYDDLFQSEAERAEEREAISFLDYKGGAVIDIGCGTGLLLDHLPWATDAYLGIDPSRGMLARLKEKHPRAEVINTEFERFHAERRFDYAAAFFGAASYIAPDSLARLPRMMRPGGRIVLMFYASSYEPVLYARSGVAVNLPRYPYQPGLLPGDAFRMGPYVVHVGEVGR